MAYIINAFVNGAITQSSQVRGEWATEAEARVAAHYALRNGFWKRSVNPHLFFPERRITVVEVVEGSAEVDVELTGSSFTLTVDLFGTEPITVVESTWGNVEEAYLHTRYITAHGFWIDNTYWPPRRFFDAIQLAGV